MTACLQRPSRNIAVTKPDSSPRERSGSRPSWLTAHIQTSKPCWQLYLLQGPEGVSSRLAPLPARLVLARAYSFAWPARYIPVWVWKCCTEEVKEFVQKSVPHSICVAAAHLVGMMAELETWCPPAPVTKPWVLGENPQFWRNAVLVTWLQLNTRIERWYQAVLLSIFQFSPCLHCCLAEGWAKLQPPEPPHQHLKLMKIPNQSLLHRGESDLWLLHHLSATTMQAPSPGSGADVSPTVRLGSGEVLKPTYLSLLPDLEWGFHSNIHESG